MKIVGIEGMTADRLRFELDRGGRFVVYRYCVSVLIMTFQRSSNIIFVKSGESALVKGLGYTAISLVAGWWGIPWGPIYTIGSIATNLKGGTDVNQEVLASLAGASA